MLIRLFLTYAGLSWFAFGVYDWVNLPGLGQTTGILASTTTSAIELRAVYGGMQMGFGLLVASGALMPRWQPISLLALAFQELPTCVGRIIAATMAGEISGYTAMAMAYEIPIALVTVGVLIHRRKPTAGPPTA